MTNDTVRDVWIAPNISLRKTLYLEEPTSFGILFQLNFKNGQAVSIMFLIYFEAIWQ